MSRSWFNHINYTITTISDDTNGTCSDIFFLEMIDSSTCVLQCCGFGCLNYIIIHYLFFEASILIIQYRIIDSQWTVRFNVCRFSLLPFFNWSINGDLSISLENRAFVTYASSANINAKRKKKKERNWNRAGGKLHIVSRKILAKKILSKNMYSMLVIYNCFICYIILL